MEMGPGLFASVVQSTQQFPHSITNVPLPTDAEIRGPGDALTLAVLLH